MYCKWSVSHDLRTWGESTLKSWEEISANGKIVTILCLGASCCVLKSLKGLRPLRSRTCNVYCSLAVYTIASSNGLWILGSGQELHTLFFRFPPVSCSIAIGNGSLHKGYGMVFIFSRDLAEVSTLVLCNMYCFTPFLFCNNISCLGTIHSFRILQLGYTPPVPKAKGICL